MTQPQVESRNGFVGLALYSPLAASGNAFVGHDGGSGGFHGRVLAATAPPELTIVLLGIYAAA